MNKTDHKILSIALPSIVSNITIPLLGIVDMAISGHLGNAVYIGAVAVGSMVFNVIYWLFGFLRMGTSGLTSQALGRRDLDDVATTLVRSMAVALGIAVAIIILQRPLGGAASWLVGATPDINAEAWRYFNICVWGAPAMLCTYSLTGWYIGMQNTHLPMTISIIQNIVNISASYTFVFALGMKVEGIAFGTLVAQYAGFAISACLWTVSYGKRLRKHVRWRSVAERGAMVRFICVNRDIFLRTLCLVAVNFYFLSVGATQGAVILAVNTLLMQLFTLFSYVMDGFAYAGEAMCGRLYGAGCGKELRHVTRRLFRWGLALSAAYTLTYAIGGSGFLSLLTDDTEVVAVAKDYLPWAVLIPVCGLTAFVFDGIFIGITATRGMLMSSAIAAVTFFAICLSLRPSLHNHALWISFLMFLIMRGCVCTIYYFRFKNKELNK